MRIALLGLAIVLFTVPALPRGGSARARPKSGRSIKPKARSKSKRSSTRKAKYRRSARRMSDYKRLSIRTNATGRASSTERRNSTKRSSVRVRTSRTSFRSSMNRRRTWSGSTRRRVQSIRSSRRPRAASVGSLRTMKAQNYRATRTASVTSARSRVERGEKALQSSKYAVRQVPLRPQVAKYRSAFTSGSVRVSVTSKPTTLYRVFGGAANQKGGWLTSQRPTSSTQARRDYALKPQWNSCNRWSKVSVPKGTMVYKGTASAQGKGLPGGAKQVLVDHSDRGGLKYGAAQSLN
ncbi:MAG: hypothetical protein OER88_02165 [Planctomycetota bacterium]|nr:hypothetical protein [Planctomycetota bacterium]